VNSLTDQQLLRDYAKSRSETAFAELVHRHVDHVYSTALRLVCDAQLAEDVAQGVFIALARSAGQLIECVALSGWLHRTTQNIASQTVRTEVRRRAREQEAVAMNELPAHESEAAWDQVAPQLDQALSELSQPDRDALMLRYFERKSAKEIGQILKLSSEAAQKRVTRATDRLREIFARREIAIGVNGLAVLISANAVKAAPIGLATTISTVVTLSGAAIATTTATTVTKAIIMTTVQKTLIAVTLVTAVGIGVFQANQNSQLRGQVRDYEQKQGALAEQIRQLQSERDAAAKRLASLTEGISKEKSNLSELLTMRSQLTGLKTAARQGNDPFVQEALKWKARKEKLQKIFRDDPSQAVPEMQLINDETFLDVARENNDLDSEVGMRTALSRIRFIAKNNFAAALMSALKKYVDQHKNQLPKDMLELNNYFDGSENYEPMLQQYKLLYSGKMGDLPQSANSFVVTDKTVIDPDYDQKWHIGPNGYGPEGRGPDGKPMSSSSSAPSGTDILVPELAEVFKAFAADNNGQTSLDPAQLEPYLKTPQQKAAWQQIMQMKTH